MDLSTQGVATPKNWALGSSYNLNLAGNPGFDVAAVDESTAPSISGSIITVHIKTAAVDSVADSSMYLWATGAG